MLLAVFCVVMEVRVVVDALEFVVAMICDGRSRLFVDCSKELGRDKDNCDCDCWFCWACGGIVSDGVGVMVVDGEVVAALRFSTDSDIVDWSIFVVPLRSDMDGMLLVSSCVSQMIERSTSQAKSAVGLHNKFV